MEGSNFVSISKWTVLPVWLNLRRCVTDDCEYVVSRMCCVSVFATLYIYIHIGGSVYDAWQSIHTITESFGSATRVCVNALPARQNMYIRVSHVDYKSRCNSVNGTYIHIYVYVYVCIYTSLQRDSLCMSFLLHTVSLCPLTKYLLFYSTTSLHISPRQNRSFNITSSRVSLALFLFFFPLSTHEYTHKGTIART